MTATPYTGRFAPSPTGALHFGSLVAALASWLDARAAGGLWRVRIEDLDTPRCIPGAADAILAQLDAYGLVWDGAVLYQSTRAEAYAAAFDALRARGLVYPCACTRSQLAAASRNAAGETVYPGTCRQGLSPGSRARAWRVRVGTAAVSFEDRIHGRLSQTLADEVGDFVVRRADGLYAYQLAVVVDDAHQGITDVVRGADLFSNTPRQIHLQALLGYPAPRYAHVPLIVNAAGQKLSKQTRAPALPETGRSRVLAAALAALGQPPPADLAGAPVDTLLAWASTHWQIARVPTQPVALSGAGADNPWHCASG